MKKAGSPVALAELQALLSHIDVDANGSCVCSPMHLFMLVRPGGVHNLDHTHKHTYADAMIPTLSG